MPEYTEKNELVTLPVIALRGTVAFPKITINFEAGDESAITAARVAAASSSLLFLTTVNELLEEDIDVEIPYYRFGTVARIKQMIRTPEGKTRIIAEGLLRAYAVSFDNILDYVEADLIYKDETPPKFGDPIAKAALKEMRLAVEENMRLLSAEAKDLIHTIHNMRDVGELADFIAAHVLTNISDKISVLECVDPIARAEIILAILAGDAVVIDAENKIRERVRERIDRHQREYYLREQIKVIQEELGEGDDVVEFAQRIEAANLPAEVQAKLNKENDRLAKTPFGSAEATVLANYLDVCLSIPWNTTSRDCVNFAAVQKVLDADHTGLEDVKERIVEYIAAKQFNPDLNNQIICLVGPPGVGKTSIASSIARALNRKYVRVSLGGVRDEADIRGHRKTYVAAMPGRIITALTQAGVRNPLILLDEIDKLTRDSHGDPTSALLEVLDGEQNKSFRDHFVELPFDLSDCMFIATANDLGSIPKPLIDRMEIIELSTYTKREKLQIAKDHLIPKQLKRHGMTKRMLRITEDALIEIIDYYTREAGVRNLERTIATLCRKAGKEMLETERKSITVKAVNLKTYLGERKLLPETIEAEDPVGCVNGLAYTELGGSLLKVEVAVLDGTGKIETTGSLGDVMKESAQIAVSYVRSVAKEFGIPTDFYKTKDIHIHFPEGAIPKDGPSAGVTMVTALISALTGRAVRRDVAMTGEISLRGNVLAIGGLKEKTMAAYSAGVKTVLIPEENMRDLAKIDAMARDNLHFILCRRASDVLQAALLPAKKAVPTEPEKSTDAVAASTFVPTTNKQPQLRL